MPPFADLRPESELLQYDAIFVTDDILENIVTAARRLARNALSDLHSTILSDAQYVDSVLLPPARTVALCPHSPNPDPLTLQVLAPVAA